MISIALKHADTDQVVLCFPRLFGVLFIALASGATYWLYHHGEPSARTPLLWGGGICAVLGVLTVARRYQVVFNLQNGRYHGYRGFAFWTQPLEGSVQELRAVQLRLEALGSGGRVRKVVALDFGDQHRYWPSPIKIFSSNLAKTRETQIQLAEIFGVPAKLVDRSNGRAEAQGLDQL